MFGLFTYKPIFKRMLVLYSYISQALGGRNIINVPASVANLNQRKVEGIERVLRPIWEFWKRKKRRVRCIKPVENRLMVNRSKVNFCMSGVNKNLFLKVVCLQKFLSISGFLPVCSLNNCLFFSTQPISKYSFNQYPYPISIYQVIS